MTGSAHRAGLAGPEVTPAAELRMALEEDLPRRHLNSASMEACDSQVRPFK